MPKFKEYDYDAILEAAEACFDCPEEEVRDKIYALFTETFTVRKDRKIIPCWYIPGGEVVDHFEWCLNAWAKLIQHKRGIAA